MVICAALKLVNKDKVIVIPCYRHSNGYETLRSLHFDYHAYEVIEGFIITDNKFADRREAYQIAKENHQLPLEPVDDEELYSEDLY